MTTEPAQQGRDVAGRLRQTGRDLAAFGVKGMSARKLPNPSPRQKLGPLGARAAAPRPDAAIAQVQEKVIAEIGHELGNFFHKLYYWSDYLQEPARKTADSTAAQMLERTIRNLEQFLKVSLEYFHPIQLACSRMRAEELVEGLLFQVRAQANGTSVAIDADGDWRDAALMVDPGRFSQAFEVIVRQLLEQAGPESTLRIAVARTSRRDGTGIEIEFRLERPNDDSALFQTAAAGLCRAVAEKVVALHGGELADAAPATDARSLVLFLPLTPQ